MAAAQGAGGGGASRIARSSLLSTLVIEVIMYNIVSFYLKIRINRLNSSSFICSVFICSDVIHSVFICSDVICSLFICSDIIRLDV